MNAKQTVRAIQMAARTAEIARDIARPLRLRFAFGVWPPDPRVIVINACIAELEKLRAGSEA